MRRPCVIFCPRLPPRIGWLFDFFAPLEQTSHFGRVIRIEDVEPSREIEQYLLQRTRRVVSDRSWQPSIKRCQHVIQGGDGSARGWGIEVGGGKIHLRVQADLSERLLEVAQRHIRL